MEAWKRTYSNNDTKTVAMPYFWEKFDKENYSLWFCEYKYPEELKLIFMSCNLVTGMVSADEYYGTMLNQ
jgi:elongation factor 1-gamma